MIPTIFTRVLSLLLASVLFAGCANLPSDPFRDEGVPGSGSVSDPVDVALDGFDPAAPAVGEASRVSGTVRAVWGNATDGVLTLEVPEGVTAPTTSIHLGDLRHEEGVPFEFAFTVNAPGTHLIVLRVSTTLEEMGPVGGYRQFYAVADGTGAVDFHVDHLPVGGGEGTTATCEGCEPGEAPPVDDGNGETPEPTPTQGNESDP